MRIFTNILFFAIVLSMGWSSNYQLLWQDDFKELSDRWSRGDWVFDTNEAEFTPDNIFSNNNELSLRLTRKDVSNQGNAPQKRYWGAELFTHEEYMYGKYFIKMKPSGYAGIVSSFFLLHIDFDSNWKPLNWHEIDIEFPGKASQVQFNIRWMEKGQMKDIPVVVKLGFDASKAYHSYMIEWAPDLIAFYVDGKCLSVCRDKKILDKMNRAMSVRMNHWISDSAGWAGTFNPAVLPTQTTYKDLVVKKRLP